MRRFASLYRVSRVRYQPDDDVDESYARPRTRPTAWPGGRRDGGVRAADPTRDATADTHPALRAARAGTDADDQQMAVK